MYDYQTFELILDHMGLNEEQIADAWNLYNEMESVFAGHFDFFMTWVRIWFLD